MPLPVPHDDEPKDDFISRCMADATAKRDFPDDKQRLAVCYRQAKIREHEAQPSRMDIQAIVEFDLEGGSRDD